MKLCNKTDGDRLWTAADVRARLPRVPVRLGGDMCLGTVRGRRLEFARVRVGDACYEAAWTTLARILNRPGGFLIVD